MRRRSVLKPIDEAERELATLSPEEALAVLTQVEEKRRATSFIRYWQPYTQGKQANVFTEFTADKKIFGVLGGNRSGKSEIGAAIATAWALGKDYFRDEPAWGWVRELPIPEPPNTIWVVGLDFPTVRDVLWREKLRNGKDHPGFVPQSAEVTKTNESDYQIFFSNGSVITCKSADSGREKFQGASVDLVWIDEEPEVEIFDECYQRTVDCAGKILITLTPLVDISSGTRTPWVFDLYETFKKGEQKDIAFVNLSVLDNPYVPESEKVRLKEKWAGHPEEGARLYGDFVQRSGLVYPMWDPKKHLRKREPGGLPKGWRRIACIDPAATGVTAVLWCAISPTGDLHFYREYYQSGLVVSEHAKNILVANQGDPIDIWLIDPKWGTQRNAETHRTNQQLYKDAGIPVRLALVGEDYGLNASREYLNATTNATSSHPKAYFGEDLKNFRWEVSHYVWDFFGRGDNKGQSKDKPRKRNDHLCNCFQYICANHPHGRRLHAFNAEEWAREAPRNSYT